MDYIRQKMLQLCYWLLCLAFIKVLLIQDGICERDISTAIQKVKGQILKNYDKYVRPTNNGSNGTEVHMAFSPQQITNLDEETGIFSMDAIMSIQWKDNRLKWDKDDYLGYITLPKDYIWTPDISLHNGHSAAVDPTYDVLLIIDYTGMVMWSPPVHTQTTCPDSKPYAGDSIECMVVFGSWAHDGWEINYKFVHIFIDDFKNVHPRWVLDTSNLRAIRNVTTFECCPEPYISIHIHFPLKRRPDPAVKATRAPCILITILNLLVFWLPPDSSKKIILGAILLLASNILLVYIGMSTKNPLAVLYTASNVQKTMYLVVMTLLLQVVLVIRVANLCGPSRPYPSLIEKLTGAIGKYTCLRSPRNTLPYDSSQMKDGSAAFDSMTVKDEWKLVASAIDRVLFVIVAVIAIALHQI